VDWDANCIPVKEDSLLVVVEKSPLLLVLLRERPSHAAGLNFDIVIVIAIAITITILMLLLFAFGFGC